MNDVTKTSAFVAVAAAVLLIAWISRPSLPDSSPGEAVGQPLIEEFDPLSATELEIVKYDDETATVEQFEVAKVDGVWSIPSHHDYRADAKDHLSEAATALLNRNILSVVSESPGEHRTYGVIKPDLEYPKAGMGMLVTMKDNKDTEDDGDDDVLVSLVIGKEVPDRPGLRYVRREGEDPVYTAEVAVDKFSTEFADWIEKDLLKMSTFDIKKVEIRDYSLPMVIDRSGRPFRAYTPRGRMTLAYDSAGDPTWKMAQDETYQDKKWSPVAMADDEELDTSKLNDMKFALDDLKIVDVRPKPAGLSADLKAGEEFLKTEKAKSSMATRGFFPVETERGWEVLSNEGEVHYLMKDGVRYILRFGGIAGAGAAEKKEGKKPKDGDEKAEDEEKSATAGVNRFLFVTCEFDPSLIDKPEPEPMPKAPPAEKPTNTPADFESLKEKAPKPGDPAPKPEAKSKEDDLEAERERVEKANQRKQDEYDKEIEKGKKHVEELNDRFAGWYYIIPDSAYQKVHLGREDIVKKKEKEEDKEGKEGKGHDDHAGHGHGPMPSLMPAAKPTDTPAGPEKPEAKPPAEGVPAAKPAAKPKPAAEAAPKPETPAVKPSDPAPKP